MQMRRNDCIFRSSIDHHKSYHHKNYFCILHRRRRANLSINSSVPRSAFIYGGATSYQFSSSNCKRNQKNGVCLSCCCWLVDPSGKKTIPVTFFFADYYYFFGLFSSLDHCTFYKFGRSSILVPSLFLSKFAITRASLLS